MKKIILDLETTGLFISNRHRIVEICCLEIIDRKITGRKFHTYLNPQRKIDAAASKITGIKDFFLLDKPFFKNIVDEFLDFIIGSELIVHNAKFDIGFINYELLLLNHKIKDIKNHLVVFDTLIYSRKLYPGKKNNLDALAERCKIIVKRKYHGALLDVIILARIYFIITMMQVPVLFKCNIENKFENKFEIKSFNESKFMINKKYATCEEKGDHINFINYIEQKIYKK
ncbi:MAG: DNA polymerase III subunit epsilon [Candidatus Azosocius agrarius]|nr:MAG: DNA polymerase III subunit epsilon [Gammaproteobacteria bacterium]